MIAQAEGEAFFIDGAVVMEAGLHKLGAIAQPMVLGQIGPLAELSALSFEMETAATLIAH